MTDFAILLNAKRVGSTFLQKAIDSHPDLVGIDECFVNTSTKPTYRKSGFIPYIRPENPHKTPESYINHILEHYDDEKVVCMKILYNQLTFHSGLLEYTQKFPMIHLMRKNLVKQIISFYNMAKENHDPIAITPVQLLEDIRFLDKKNKDIAETFKDQIKLALYYEDIIGTNIKDGNRERTYLSPIANIAVCRSLGVREILMYADTKKKNKEDISVYLPNIKEIREYFKAEKGEWLWMLQ